MASSTPDTPPTNSARRYFVGGASGMFVQRIVSVAAGLGVSTILARVLGASEFGVFAFAISMATLLALPFSGGLPMLLVAEISKARETGDAETLRGAVRWGYTMQALVLAAILALVVLVYTGAQALGVWWWSERETLIALLVLGIVPLMGLMHLQRAILVGFERPVLGGLGEQVTKPASMLLLLLAFMAMLELGSVGALGLQMAANVIAVLLTLVIILRVIPKSEAGGSTIRWKEWTLAVLPLTATSATTIVSNNTDILMLGLLQPPAEAGVYRIAAQIAVLAAVLMQILRSLSAPKIAAAYAREDREGMRRLMVSTGQITTAVALAFVVVFAIAGEFALVLVFGREYAASYWPCLILAIGTVLTASCGFVSIALQMTGNAGIVAKSAIWAALANVALNLALVPQFGAVGAAIGTAVSLALMQLQLTIKARKVLHIRTDIFQSRHSPASV